MLKVLESSNQKPIVCYEKLIKNNKHIENLLYRTRQSVQKRERVVP